MTELDLNLCSRHLAAIPQRIRIVEELRGPVEFYDPIAGFEPVGYLQKNIYSVACRTEILLPRRGLGTKPIIINDLRICEIALGLIHAALQESAESQSDLVHFAITRLVLEQSIGYQPHAFQAGLLVDRIHTEALDEVLRRKHQIPVVEMSADEDRYHAEQITQLTLIHEVTHYCLFANERFRHDWGIKAAEIFDGLSRIWDADVPDEPVTDFLRVATEARLRDIETWKKGSLPVGLEESICDISAIISLVHAMDKRGALQGAFKDVLLSVWATMAATWLVTIVRATVRGLMVDGSADVSVMATVLQERAGVAVLVLTQTLAQTLSAGAATKQGMMVEAWRAQPDFEDLILGSFNSIFSSENLERILTIGSVVLQDGFSRKKDIETAILRHFRWIP